MTWFLDFTKQSWASPGSVLGQSWVSPGLGQFWVSPGSVLFFEGSYSRQKIVNQFHGQNRLISDIFIFPNLVCTGSNASNSYKC